ncbi:MAG TPA: methyltransferase domain-containing protein [Telluria sp.]|nr:methyltransferase domain-containing protein [Burkholderiaceae bacterium]HZX28297.1 methyltransferase domain-containing protein [Telluria sp.]
MNQASLSAYYADIAADYDRRYAAPRRKAELDALQNTLADLFEGRRVLELGCGTGYWTDTLAYVANSVTAIDNCPPLLAQARARGLDPQVVNFVDGDAFAPPPGDYDACLAAGLWSHVPREQQDQFLKQLRALLGADALLVLLDENVIEGETLPVARTDAEGNTYRILTGASGTRHEVLSNCPADSALKKRFAEHAREIRIKRSEHYWLLSCRLK